MHQCFFLGYEFGTSVTSGIENPVQLIIRLLSYIIVKKILVGVGITFFLCESIGLFMIV